MPRFLIEVPHESDKNACTRAVQFFLNTGSHFLTNADWGCLDDDHRAWFIADVATREDARNIVPPPFRDAARIVQLNKFAMKDIEEISDHHTP